MRYLTTIPQHPSDRPTRPAPPRQAGGHSVV